MTDKIKLKIDLPISKEHGALRNKIFIIIGEKKFKNSMDKLYYFKGRTGKRCGAYNYECTVLKTVLKTGSDE